MVVEAMLPASPPVTTAAATPAATPAAKITITKPSGNGKTNSIKIVFSDVDGTLVHYPDNNDERMKTEPHEDNDDEKLLRFPPSSTGLEGVISYKTIALVDTIRIQQNVKFVLVSGMRTSTLLQRLPYLPKADAYCSENGGRIFYPVENGEEGDGDDVFWIQPKSRHQKPFGIREDTAWRERMTKAMGGGNSYGVWNLAAIRNDPAATSMPLNERDGSLWEFARNLIDHHGLVLDAKGYATCFRVNQKQQLSQPASSFDSSKISALATSTISSSVNLKCVDFYPSCSGKKNCCLYLASKFFPEDCKDATNDFLLNNAVCMCDDDNDLEMALACRHAYLPEISSQSMRETVDKFPDRFTITFRENEFDAVKETDASDLALSLIWERTKSIEEE